MKNRFSTRHVIGKGIFHATNTPRFIAMMPATVENAIGTVGKMRSLGFGGVQVSA